MKIESLGTHGSLLQKRDLWAQVKAQSRIVDACADVCGCFLVGLEKISEPRGLKVRGTGLLLGVVYLGIT